MSKVIKMDCHSARSHWNIFYDSEGDAETHFKIEQHLASCDQCRKWFDGQESVERNLTKAINSAELMSPPLVDWDQLLNEVGVVPEKSIPNLRRRASRSLILLTAVAASVIALISFGILRSGIIENTPSLVRESIAVHRFVAMGSLRPDFESTSDIEVDRYLVRRASFPVRCPPRKDSGFEVNGAGMVEFDGQAVAYVVGSVDARPISIFVLPKGHLDLIPKEQRPKVERQVRFQTTPEWLVAYAVIDKNLVLVVGNTTRAKLEKVLSSYGTYPHES
jgi:hypothetical protein